VPRAVADAPPALACTATASCHPSILLPPVMHYSCQLALFPPHASTCLVHFKQHLNTHLPCCNYTPTPHAPFRPFSMPYVPSFYLPSARSYYHQGYICLATSDVLAAFLTRADVVALSSLPFP